MDIVDNTDTLRIREAMEMIEEKIIRILLILAEKIKQYAWFPVSATRIFNLQNQQPSGIA